MGNISRTIILSCIPHGKPPRAPPFGYQIGFYEAWSEASGNFGRYGFPEVHKFNY